MHTRTFDDRSSLGVLAEVMARHYRVIFKEFTEQRTAVQKQRRQSMIWGGVGIFISLLLLILTIASEAPALLLLVLGGIVLTIVFFVKANRLSQTAETMIPTKNITEVGRFFLKFQKVPFRDKHVVLDCNGLFPNMEFQYSMLEDMESVDTAYKQAAHIFDGLPAVQSTENRTVCKGKDSSSSGGSNVVLYDREAGLVRTYVGLTTNLKKRKMFTAQLPVIASNKDLLNYIQLEAVTGIPGDLSSIGGDVDYTNEILQLEGRGMNESGSGEDNFIDSLLPKFKVELNQNNAWLDESRKRACENILPEYIVTNMTEPQLLGFEALCPFCNHEFIESLTNKTYVHGAKEQDLAMNRSAHMQYYPDEKKWRCVLCEEVTDSPYMVPRMITELFMPSYERMMEENRVERLRVFNGINDQKRSYFNESEKELAQKEENRNRDVHGIKMKIKEGEAAVRGNREMIERFTHQISEFDLIHGSSLNHINSATREIAQQIEEDTRRALHEYEMNIHQNHARRNAEMAELAELYRKDKIAHEQMLRSIAENSERRREESEKHSRLLSEQNALYRAMISD